MDCRYQLEHGFLPSVLYSENGEHLIRSILSRRGLFFVDVLSFLGRNDGYQCPYKESDFQFKPVLVGRDGDPNQFAVLEIDMPKPKFSPQCHRVYICHDARFSKFQYFTLEMGFDGGKVLCGWNADGVHLNYGSADDSEEELFHRIAGIWSR